MLPTAIAPTIELATPRVERFAKRLAEKSNAEIVEFYECEPAWCSAQTSGGEKFAMGSWGLELKGSPVIPTVASNAIKYEVQASNCRDNTVVWLHGRVLR